MDLGLKSSKLTAKNLFSIYKWIISGMHYSYRKPTNTGQLCGSHGHAAVLGTGQPRGAGRLSPVTQHLLHPTSEMWYVCWGLSYRPTVAWFHSGVNLFQVPIGLQSEIIFL